MNKILKTQATIIKYFPTIFFLIVLFPISSIAHTTALIPHTTKDKQKTIKAIHFHPATGSGIMGIRLNAKDSSNTKGLDSFYLIHNNEKKNLNSIAIPDYYTIRGQKGETYSIPINKKNGFFRPGDYIIVAKHNPHWKKSEGLYRQKVTKFCLNLWGDRTDWPNRVLESMPEIIPLVPPYNVYAGSIFRAEAVNDEGALIPYAKIQIEYLNYKTDDKNLVTSTEGFIKEDIADTMIFTDSKGSFSFIPLRKGLWTFTLVDGDNNKLIKEKILEYDSSLSILVK